MKIQFDTPPASATHTNGLSVRYAAARRKVAGWRWYLLLALVLAAPLYFAVKFALAMWWQMTPAVVITEQITVRAPQAGLLRAMVSVGAHLAAGERVALIESPAPAPAPALASPAPASTAPTTALAAVQAHEKALAERAATLREALRITERQWALQQERLRTLQTLRAQGAATRQEVDNARFQEMQAQADLNRARADVREHALRQAQHEARHPDAGAAPAPATPAAVAQETPLYAPAEATMVRQGAAQGEWVAAGAEIATLKSYAPPVVHAYVAPQDVRYAEPGQSATLRFLDGARVRAEVVGVVAEAERTPADRVSPLTPRPPSIVVRLRPLEPLPAAYRIHHLPLDVRFDRAWAKLW